MTREEVLDRVREMSAANNWPLNEHVSVHQEDAKTGLLFGKVTKTWVVKTDVNRRGGNRVFEFDDETGELRRCFVLPR